MERLEHQRTDSACIFRVLSKSGPVPIEKWPACQAPRASGNRPADIGTVLRLMEDEAAHEVENFQVAVPWSTIAALDPDCYDALGLPGTRAIRIELYGQGSFTEPSFRIRLNVHYDTGQPVPISVRQGAIVRDAESEWTLADPFYSIVERVQAINDMGDSHPESKMLAWSELRTLLPDETSVDGYLNETSIVLASGVELQLRIDGDGFPNVDPIPGRISRQDDFGGETRRLFVEALSKARIGDFQRRFSSLRKVNRRYSAGAGSYVIFSEPTMRVLEAIRELQNAPGPERLHAIQNIDSYLRAKLDADELLSDVDLDDVFHSEGFGDRVRGIGAWQPRAVPWVRREGSVWIPADEPGGEGSDLTADELSELISLLEAALARGEEAVSFKGRTHPATLEHIAFLRSLLPPEAPKDPLDDDPSSPISPHEGGDGGGNDPGPPITPTEIDDPGTPYCPNGDRVLIVHDNLDHVTYERRPGSRPGDIGRLPTTLHTPLHPHQIEALRWLQSHWTLGTPGALLADDMGLGKTLETLSFLAWIRDLQSRELVTPAPLLIVAPTGLLQNWIAEMSRHLDTDGLGYVLRAYGSGLRSLREQADGSVAVKESALGLATLDLGELRSADCVLTTYETLRDYQLSFGQVAWCAAVFDEAQKIKNPAARLTDAALAMNIDFAITMTGTPVENRPADVWSLIERCQPGILRSLKEFSNAYERTGTDEAALDELRIRLQERDTPPVMLRRLKEDHLESIPTKIEHRLIAKMPAKQADAYSDAIDSARQGGVAALETIQLLRSISLHPEKPFGQDPDAYISESSRLTETFKVLDDIRRINERALIFVESIAMQDFLCTAIPRRFGLPHRIMVINGQVSGKSRQTRVDEFQTRDDFDVMLLSPKAGGVGLTLTGANHVIHLSRWWNAAVEDQCTDRVYRIGQERTVHVYLPLAVHPTYGESSFDLLLDELISRKRGLNRSILAPTTLTSSDAESLAGRATGKEVPSEPIDPPAEPYPIVELSAIDIMEPLQFERWVLGELRLAGYDARPTTLQDGGADVIAWKSDEVHSETLLVQCKHTQSGKSLTEAAVREVVRSTRRYADRIRGDLRLVVVSNARGFTDQAQRVAREGNVILLGRDELIRVRALWRS